jgi:ABC-type sugar transport system ATPase subunit
VTQETTLAPDLSITENVFLGHRMVRRGPVIDWRATRRRALEAVRRLGLDVDPSVPVRRLRPDQQQLVEIARALTIDARVLVLDEPTSSLTDDEVASLFGRVRALRDDGVAIIFVSHRLKEVFELADRITVLRDGRTVGEAPASELDRPALIRLMVGRSLEEIEPPAAQDRGGNPALRLRGLSVPRSVSGVDLEVEPGEIVGLAGLVGAGRSELLELVFGLHRPSGGTVEIDGSRVTFNNPRQAIAGGVAFVPADRKLQGLVHGMSVRENLVMASTSRFARLRRPATRRELSVVRDAFEGMRIRASSARVPVATLSGGNQQKVVLGKWLATSPRVLMLDEPTRGVDVGAKGEIYQLLFDAAEQGVAIVVSSSENQELLTLCDRVLVMFRGRVAAELPRPDATEARIAHFAGGHR